MMNSHKPKEFKIESTSIKFNAQNINDIQQKEKEKLNYTFLR